MMRGAALTVLLGIVLTACSAPVPAEPTGVAPTAPASPVPGQPSPTNESSGPPDPRPPTHGLLTPDNIRSVLVAAGVQLVGDDGTTVVAGPAGSEVPLILPDASIDRLSIQAHTHTGLLGSTIDELGGGPPTALPPSALLSAYALAVDTDGADVARAALGEQDLTDPKSVVFPALVHLLFAADAVHEIGDEASAANPILAAGLAKPAPEVHIVPAAFMPCSLFADVVFGSINKVFDKLHIPAGRVGATGSKFLDAVLQGLTDVVIAGLNIVVEAGRTLVINGIRLLIADVVNLIAEVSSIIALVGTVLANVDPISLIADPQPPQVTRGTSPVTDVVTLSAHVLGPDEWPAQLNDCAVVSTGSPLPPLKPVDSPVIWTIFESPAGIDLAHRSATGSDDVLKAVPGRDAEAKLVLETGNETAEQVKEPPVNGLVKVTAGVKRTGLKKVQEALVALALSAAGNLTGKLPEPFKGYVNGLLAGALQSATNGFTTLLDTKTFTLVSVIYHGNPRPSPSPRTSPGSPAPSDGLLTLPNPCSLITLAEATEAAGNEVESGVQVPSTIDHLGSGIGCPFRNPNPDGPAFTAFVRIDAIDLGSAYQETFAAYEREAEAGGVKSGEIAGLGDDNFYLRAPEGATNLLVRKKNIALLVVVLTANGLDQTTRLAGLALERF